MALVSLTCPSCSGEISLDESKEFGFCMYCGNKVAIKDETQKIEISGKIKIDDSEKLINCLNLAGDAYKACNYLEAYNYYTKVLEIDGKNVKAMYRKALCAGYLSNQKTPRTIEIVNGVKKSFELIGNDTEEILGITSELINFSINFYPINMFNSALSAYDNIIQCKNFEQEVIAAVNLANQTETIIPECAEEQKKILLSYIIALCDGINGRSVLNYKSNKLDKDGKQVEIINRYCFEKSNLEIIGKIRKTAVDTYNAMPSVKRGEALIINEIEDYNDEINNHKANVKEIWKANKDKHKEYKKVDILYCFLGVLCCVAVVLFPLGIVLFVLRNKKKTALKSEVFSAEVFEKEMEMKTIKSNLKKKEKELNTYRNTNFKI